MSATYKLKNVFARGNQSISNEVVLVYYGLLLASFTSLMGFIVNLYLFGWDIMTRITLAGTIFYFLVFLIARKTPAKAWSKWLLTVSLCVYTDYLWFHNFGSKGPILYIYVILYSLYLFLFDGRERLGMILFFLLNTVLLFYIEYAYPELFSNYTSEHSRVIDIYSGIFIYLLVATGLMTFVKIIYIKEKENAQNADRLKTAFLANLSHEIRTPMNSILGFSQLLERNLTPEKRSQYIEAIHKNGDYLVHLIDDIIDISTIESGQLKIHKSYFSLKELFQTIHSMLSQDNEKLDPKNVNFTYSLKPEDLMIYTDQLRLSQILTNLLTNSLKFTESGHIHFSCEKTKNKLNFQVTDTGIGISTSDQKKVFERFFKSENSGQKLYPGTGIGLSISKELVQKLGGELTLSSEEGKGTTFRFTLPLHENATG